MASSPDSQPDGPPPPTTPPSSESNSTSPPPPALDSQSPPSSTNSSTPPPQESKAPPPTTTTSPPPSPPASPPPSPPPNSQPPNNAPPPKSSPPPTPSPPQSPPPSPPPQSQDSPPPASSSSSPPPPTVHPSPPPATPRPSSSPPALVDSPPSPPPPTTNTPPSPVNFSPPPTPPNNVNSPPANSSSPSVSVPIPPSNSGTSVSNQSTPSVPSKSDGHEHDHTVAGIAIGSMAVVIIIGAVLGILLLKRRRKKQEMYSTMYMVPSPYNSSPASGISLMKPNSTGGEILNSSPEPGGLGNPKTWFTFEELTKATNGFASQNILGTGGFGSVYKGCLPDGREVAVKKLKDNSGQGDREFKAEVEIISRVHHRHLVSLVGYCITDNQKLLVYEFVPNNTLHHHLHASDKPVMQWPLRIKVACGSARGIAYLHEDCNPRIIHRDIKSANILLENNFEAKVADFGLAKLAQELESHSHVSTRVMGTFGYMAPEYASSGKLTEKSDVFSFGVVLLELITGRKPVDETRPLGDESLVEWARPLMTEAIENQNFDELADPRLEGNYDRGEMFRMIEAAAACVRHSVTKRPKMSQLLRELDTLSEQPDLTNGMKPGQSTIYDSREQSAQIRMFQRMTYGSQEMSPEYFNDSQGSWTSGERSGQF